MINFTVASNNQAEFSRIHEIIKPELYGYKFEPYATGELGSWPFDGKTKLFPNRTGNFGYVSDSFSDDANCQFNEPAIVSLNCDYVVSQEISGLDIVWSKAFDEMAHEITLIARLDGAEVNQKTFLLDPTAESKLEFRVKDFDRIDVAINKWCLPLHRARIERIDIIERA